MDPRRPGPGHGLLLGLVAEDPRPWSGAIDVGDPALTLVFPAWDVYVEAAAIVVAFGLAGEGLSRLVQGVGRRAGVRDTTVLWTRDTIRIIWIILAVVGVAYVTGLASEITVLAVSTIGGLVISLALQATLTNVIAGIFLLEDGTLRLGDDITYSSISGRVIRITLRTSWIMTDKGVIAAVANSQLMNGPLVNRTATGRLVARYHLPTDSVSAGSATGTSGPTAAGGGTSTASAAPTGAVKP